VRPSALATIGLAALLLFAGIARAENGWQPLVTQDGVSVQERTAPGRAMPELQATAEIDAGIFDVLAVIADVPRQTEWMHDCAESRRVRRDGPDASLIYNRTSAPWPVSDRDAVLRSQTTLLEPMRHVTVRFSNVTDPGTPPVEGVVRMPRLVGGYELVSLSPARTRVTYTIDLDPGGSLPAWAAARTARETPLETMLGLRRQVEATRGKYAEFVTAWSGRR
jgi:hypothetical protein